MNGLWGKCRGALPMADKRRLNLSFSMSQSSQRTAWKHLSAIPAGQRTEAICSMVNGYMDQQALLDAVRGIIREELHGVSFVTEKPQPEQAGDVDADVLGFLRALQEGDETI